MVSIRPNWGLVRPVVRVLSVALLLFRVLKGSFLELVCT